MEKAFKMGKASATGSFQLLLGVATSTVVMALGTIILTRFMSPAEYGLYSVVLIPSAMISLFRDWGVNTAVTKYVANLRATDRDRETREVIVAGVIFEIITGLCLSILSVFLANFIASAVFHRPESTSLIAIASITIFSGSLVAVAQSSFIGFERMELNSLVVICQSIVKTVAAPILVIFGFGVFGAIIGYTLSFIAAAIIGLIVLYFTIFKPLTKYETSIRDILKVLKTMLKYGVPLSVASVVGGALSQFYGFVMAIYSTDMMIGNYQAAINFAVLLTFFTVPIGTVLFPMFAKLDPQSENGLLKTVFASSIKYASILLVPATMAMIVLARPMISTLFGERYAFAPFFLALYVASNLLVVIGSLSVSSFLTGVGETKVVMKQSILTLSVGVVLAFLLIPTLGVTGVILGSMFSSLPSLAWALFWIWKRYRARADIRISVRILLASAVATTITYVFLNFIVASEWIRLIIGATIFLAVYIFAAPMVGAIIQSDLDNLRIMLSGIGPVSKLVDLPLVLTEKICRLRSRYGNQQHHQPVV